MLTKPAGVALQMLGAMLFLGGGCIAVSNIATISEGGGGGANLTAVITVGFGILLLWIGSRTKEESGISSKEFCSLLRDCNEALDRIPEDVRVRIREVVEEERKKQ